MAKVLVWVCEGTWPAVIDAARSPAFDGAEFTLLHAGDEELPEAAHGAALGLFGRGHDRDPGDLIASAADEAAAGLLDRAAARLDRPCDRIREHGHPERIVVSAAASGYDLLILARDGDVAHLGPKSLGKHGRFVVDHAPCQVLLVWPSPPPDVSTIPPRPPHPPGPPEPPHRP